MNADFSSAAGGYKVAAEAGRAAHQVSIGGATQQRCSSKKDEPQFYTVRGSRFNTKIKLAARRSQPVRWRPHLAAGMKGTIKRHSSSVVSLA